MDIAKYIGLFLLKNNFCYLHGLGNLELKKKPSKYEDDALHAPEYDVVLTPGGSIDDTLANFIATHEQTSISKAANQLREFSAHTKAELAAGKQVEIPGVGYFYEQNGAVKFAANAQLKHVPPPIPTLRMAKRLEETPEFRQERETPAGKAGSVAWSKILVTGVLLLVIIAGVIFGIRYYNSSGSVTTNEVETLPQQEPAPVAVLPVIDTVVAKDTIIPVATPMAVSSDPNAFTVVINAYTSRAAADRRAGFLKKNGNEVSVLTRDSLNHFVTMEMKIAPADTTHVLDSLRRFFNPKGVYILR